MGIQLGNVDQIQLRYIELVDGANSVIHPVIVPLSENTTVVSEPASEGVSNASPPEVSIPVPAASPVRLSMSPVTTPLRRSSRVSKHQNVNIGFLCQQRGQYAMSAERTATQGNIVLM